MEFMKKSLTDIMIPALEMDSYASSHPISTSASTPDEIREIFDIITYQKGHCMVQMLHEYLGKDFQRGLQRYLKTYSYKNADQDDLWRELRSVKTTYGGSNKFRLQNDECKQFKTRLRQECQFCGKGMTL